MMKKHLPNMLTLANLLTGAIGSVWMLQAELDAFMGIYIVIIAAFFDFLDGFVARLLKVSSAIGKELDSLADLVSFGLLPAVVVYLHVSSLTYSAFLPLAAFLILAFSALRLAKFNIDTRQTDQFIGLPTPANALFITGLVFMNQDMRFAGMSVYLENPFVWLGIVIVCSIALVSELPLLALKFKNFSLTDNKARFLLIAVALLLLASVQFSAVPLVILFYVLLSIITNRAVRQPNT
jgi:CDP-diacylglycerol---serine O-phosphatidyltransferase